MRVKWASVLKRGLVVIVVLGIPYAVLMVLSTISLHRAYADLRADGRPLKAEDVIPMKIPDSQNGAVPIEAAIRDLKAKTVPGGSLFKRLDDLSGSLRMPDERAQALVDIRPLLEEEPVQEALRMVSEGVEKPDCSYDLDYTKGMEIGRDHLADLRALIRIVKGKALTQVADQDYSGAWKTAITALRLADTIKVLKDAGYLWARRGPMPDTPSHLTVGGGPLYDPTAHDPLLIPT